MKKNILIIIIAAIIGGLSGIALYNGFEKNFSSLGPDEMHNRIITERDIAISKAKENGDYRCCIEPPCTMCYMEANQWNHNTPGTCACDDLIALGEEPCPQCKRGIELIHNDQGTYCDVTDRISTCDAQIE